MRSGAACFVLLVYILWIYWAMCIMPHRQRPDMVSREHKLRQQKLETGAEG